jgi:hypothetical protein
MYAPSKTLRVSISPQKLENRKVEKMKKQVGGPRVCKSFFLKKQKSEISSREVLGKLAARHAATPLLNRNIEQNQTSSFCR